MKLSEDRCSHLAHLLLNAANDENLAKPHNTRLCLTELKQALEAGPGNRSDAVDAFVRHKIASLSRKVVPGSTEWDILYREYAEQEQRKRR